MFQPWTPSLDKGAPTWLEPSPSSCHPPVTPLLAWREGGRLPCCLHPSGVCFQGHRVGSHIDNPDFPAHNRALAPFGFLPNHDRAGGVTQGHWCDLWIHTGSVCLGSELTGRQKEVPIPSEQGHRPQWVAPNMGHHEKQNQILWSQTAPAAPAPCPAGSGPLGHVQGINFALLSAGCAGGTTRSWAVLEPRSQ